MTRKELIDNIYRKKSFLCVGLDTDIKKMPRHIAEAADPIFSFNKAIIDPLHVYCTTFSPRVLRKLWS